jgi:hypothetical protein
LVDKKFDIKFLKIVTNETFKELKEYEVITPDLYKETFEAKLKRLNSTDVENINLDNPLTFNLEKLQNI